MSKNQILSSLTEIEKLLKRNEQLLAKTKPTKYLIISRIPLYKLINQTRVPFHRQIGRDICVIDIELELEKDNEEDNTEKLGKDGQRSDVSIQKSDEDMEDETEPP